VINKFACNFCVQFVLTYQNCNRDVPFTELIILYRPCHVTVMGVTVCEHWPSSDQTQWLWLNQYRLLWSAQQFFINYINTTTRLYTNLPYHYTKCIMISRVVRILCQKNPENSACVTCKFCTNFCEFCTCRIIEFWHP